MVTDLPDYTKQVTVLLKAEILSQTRTLPWWIRYQPKRILFLDDFEGVLKWQQNLGTVAKSSSINAFESSNSLLLTTDALANEQAQAVIQLGAVERSKMMMQYLFNPNNAGVNCLHSITTQLTIIDGIYESWAYIRYLNYEGGAQNKWQYWNENGTWADIPNAAEVINCYLNRNHFIRLDVDFSLNKLVYSRLITPTLDLDLSNLLFEHKTTVSEPMIIFSLAIQTWMAYSAKCYFDAFCLSDQET